MGRFCTKKVFACAALWGCSVASWGQAAEMGAGVGATTQGDGFVLPSAHVWADAAFGLASAATIMGRKNSAFTQQLANIRLGYSESLPKLKTVRAFIGLGGVLQRTLLFRQNNSTEQLNSWSRAAGLALGSHWNPRLSSSIDLRIGWDALFVPPGETSIYLTFGHVQSVYCGFGWRF